MSNGCPQLHVAVVKGVPMLKRLAVAGEPFGSNDIEIFRVLTCCTGNPKELTQSQAVFRASPTVIVDGPPQAEFAMPVLLTLLSQK